MSDARFEHPCPDCVFLGEFEDFNSYDLYVCVQDQIAYFLARYGDNYYDVNVSTKYLGYPLKLIFLWEVEILQRALFKGTLTLASGSCK